MDAAMAEFLAMNAEGLIEEVHRLRRVLLRRIRDDNDCQPMPQCTGWGATQCRCAEEARNAYATQL